MCREPWAGNGRTCCGTAICASSQRLTPSPRGWARTASATTPRSCSTARTFSSASMPGGRSAIAGTPTCACSMAAAIDGRRKAVHWSARFRHACRNLADQWTAFRLPSIAAAIEQAHVGVPAIAERPPGIEAELNVLAVEHDRGVVADAVLAQPRGEGVRRWELAHMAVPQHVLPFPAHGSRHMAGPIGRHLVLPEPGDFDQSDFW